MQAPIPEEHVGQTLPAAPNTIITICMYDIVSIGLCKTYQYSTLCNAPASLKCGEFKNRIVDCLPLCCYRTDCKTACDWNCLGDRLKKTTKKKHRYVSLAQYSTV